MPKAPARTEMTPNEQPAELTEPIVDQPKIGVADGMPSDGDAQVSVSSGQARPAPDEAEDVDCDGKPLPAWTKRYAKSDRRLLAEHGDDPSCRPRAHEFNLRLAETSSAFDKARFDWGSPSMARGLWQGVVNEIHARVYGHDYATWTAKDDLEVFAGRKPIPTLLPARAAEEIEVRPDWLGMYPPEHARLLSEWGVPTIAGSLVDVFNRRLIELVSPGCVDEAEIREAARKALSFAFGARWVRECLEDVDLAAEREYAHDARPETELEDDCWQEYPVEQRDLLQAYGRPDYEHHSAEAFNRAVVAAAQFLRDRGPGDPHSLLALRDHLWRAFFSDQPSVVRLVRKPASESHD